MLSALVLLVGLSVLVFARMEGENLDGSVQLKKGWNLVTLYTFDDDSWERGDLGYEGIRAAYFYNRYNDDYIRLYPGLEKDKMSEFASQMGDPEEGGSIYEYGGYVNSAIWVYSEKNQIINFRTLDGPLFPEHVGLKSGWNFLAVTPEFIDKSLNDLKGDCNIIKSYGWWTEQQDWDLIANDVPFHESTLWRGIVIKVSNDCTLGSSGVTEPPTLPE